MQTKMEKIWNIKLTDGNWSEDLTKHINAGGKAHNIVMPDFSSTFDQVTLNE